MRTVRTLAALIFTGVSLSAAVIGGPVALADPGSCTPSRGVVVAVDFSHWGGAVRRGCDPSPSTGYNALQVAGFSTAGTFHDGPAFVCRIDELPSVRQDSCHNTPPATAYWSYWHSDAGQSAWSYSTLGATSYHPRTGSVEGWAFGSGSPPNVSPDSVRATAPAPPAPAPAPATTPPVTTPVDTTQPGRSTTGNPPTTQVEPAPPATTSSPRASATSGRPPGPTPSASAASRSPSASTRAGSTASGTGSSGPSVVSADAAASRSGSSSGSPVAVLLGVGAAAALAVAAGVTAWRRRSG